MNRKDDVKERVLMVLQSLEEGERIKAAALILRTGIPTARALREVIRELRHEGYLIGAAREGKHGYFLIRNAEELDATVRTMEAAAYDQIKTAENLRKAFQKKHSIIQLPGRSARKGEKL